MSTRPSVLDRPIGESVDEREFLEAAMRWHFDPLTGSPFWIERAKSLDFDPLTDIRTFADLRRFPNVVDEMRGVPMGDLIPKGYGEKPGVFGVFDSGGTTGVPKRVIVLEDWVDRQLTWQDDQVEAHGVERGQNICFLGPSGPHMFGAYTAERARRTNSLSFPVDLDPRWVKRCIADGRAKEAELYVEHLLEQARYILHTQDIGLLIATPPLLEQMARHDDLVEVIRSKVKGIQWGGAHMDADTRYLFRTEVFPDARIIGNYGSAMMLGGVIERPGTGATDDRCIFDPLSPYVTFAVVDAESREPVAMGERGQVLMHHVSKNMLLPNNLERDMGTRVEALPGHFGDAVADVSPVASFEGQKVIEGVY